MYTLINFSNNEYAPFAAPLTFELYREKTTGQYYVYATYDRKEIKIGTFCDTYCSYTQFKEILDKRMIPTWINEACRT